MASPAYSRLGTDERRRQLLEERLQLARLHIRLQPRAQIHSRRFTERHDGRGHRHVVRDHDRVLALGEGHVEESERHHHALDLTAHAARLEADAIAYAEGARAQQQNAGEDVAEGVLRGETEDDSGERAADRERARVETCVAQRHEQRDTEQQQAD